MMHNIKMTQEITDEIILNVINDSKKDSVLIDSKNEMVTRIHEYEKLGIVVAATDGNKTYGIGGVGKVHSGLGIAWLILNKQFLKYPKTLLKFSRLIIRSSLVGLDLHRIQMDVDTTYDENSRFAKKLGFEFEGRMYQYGPDQQDYDRYVLLRKNFNGST